MAIEFSCESCGKRFTAKDEHAGRRAKCSGCGCATRIPMVASVKYPLPSASMPQPPAPETKQCPFCAENIKVEARKCRFCGEILDPTLQADLAASRSMTKPSGSEMGCLDRRLRRPIRGARGAFRQIGRAYGRDFSAKSRAYGGALLRAYD